MNKISSITPYGQVTIPRSIMRILGLKGGADVAIEIEEGKIILKKVDKNNPGVGLWFWPSKK